MWPSIRRSNDPQKDTAVLFPGQDKNGRPTLKIVVHHSKAEAMKERLSAPGVEHVIKGGTWALGVHPPEGVEMYANGKRVNMKASAPFPGSAGVSYFTPPTCGFELEIPRDMNPRQFTAQVMEQLCNDFMVISKVPGIEAEMSRKA